MHARQERWSDKNQKHMHKTSINLHPHPVISQKPPHSGNHIKKHPPCLLLFILQTGDKTTKPPWATLILWFSHSHFHLTELQTSSSWRSSDLTPHCLNRSSTSRVTLTPLPFSWKPRLQTHTIRNPATFGHLHTSHRIRLDPWSVMEEPPPNPCPHHNKKRRVQGAPTGRQSLCQKLQSSPQTIDVEPSAATGWKL